MKKILFLCFAVSMFAYIDGGDTPNGHAGEPPRYRHCGRCHVGGPTGAEAWYSVFPDYYEAGETYSITVNMSHPSLITWGFQLVVMDGSNNIINTLSPADGNTMVSSAGYMNQTRSGAFVGSTGEVSWTFNWTAPSSDIGTLTFYASFVAGDNNDSDSRDTWCNLQRTTEYSSAVDEKIPADPNIIYNVYDISGRLITTSTLRDTDGRIGRGVFLARPVDGNGETRRILNLQ